MYHVKTGSRRKPLNSVNKADTSTRNIWFLNEQKKNEGFVLHTHHMRHGSPGRGRTSPQRPGSSPARGCIPIPCLPPAFPVSLHCPVKIKQTCKTLLVISLSKLSVQTCKSGGVASGSFKKKRYAPQKTFCAQDAKIPCKISNSYYMYTHSQLR